MASTDVSRTVSPSPSATFVEHERDVDEKQAPPSAHATNIASISNAHKFILLIAFSIAQFLDVLNVSALFSAIPAITEHLSLTSSESVWLISAYQLTFASFLLLSGRLSDLFNTKYLFNIGFGSLGLLSLGAGFVRNKIGLFVLRALTGIAGSLTIPAALSLIVHLFPNPHEQARAIGIFGGMAALGNVLGVIVGALLVQYTSWSWIFWLNSCLAIPIAALCVIIIPSPKDSSSDSLAHKMKRLDLIGVSTLTAAFVLFIFAVTSGSADGWNSARVLAPLIISIFMIIGFLSYEAWIPEERAALPPRIWFFKNFAVLFGISLFPFLWWSTLFLTLMPLWQDVYGYSPVLAGVRFLPVGVLAFIVMMFSAYLQKTFKLKHILLSGAILIIPATVLLTQANAENRYWPYVFPALLIGTVGCTLIFSNANIAMFKYTPPEMAGTVGAIFNSALQVGSAVGLAAVTSIETNVENKKGGFSAYNGRAAGWWFIFGLVIIVALAITIFIREDNSKPVEVESPQDTVAQGEKNTLENDLKAESQTEK